MAHDDEIRAAGPMGHRPRHSEHEDIHDLKREMREVNTKLDTLLGHAKRTEKSVGLAQGAWERNEPRLIDALTQLGEIKETMARTAAEWDAALDGLQTAVVTAVTAEADQIKVEIERLKGLVGPDLEPQFARATQMATDFATNIGKVWDAEAPPPEPVPEPPMPPVEGRRR